MFYSHEIFFLIELRFVGKYELKVEKLNSIPSYVTVLLV